MDCLGKLIQISSEGLTFVPNKEPTTIMYSDILRVNDGKWHHVTVDSHYREGKYHVRFTTDGSTVGTTSIPAAVISQDTL